MALTVHGQDGARGINPPTTRTSNHETGKSAARYPAERTARQEAAPQRLAVPQPGRQKLLERAPPGKRVSGTGVCVPPRGSPSPGPPGVTGVTARRREERTREQEAGAADQQGQGPDRTPRPGPAAGSAHAPRPSGRGGHCFIGCNFKFKAVSSQVASVSVVDRPFQEAVKNSHWRGCRLATDWPPGPPTAPEGPPQGVLLREAHEPPLLGPPAVHRVPPTVSPTMVLPCGLVPPKPAIPLFPWEAPSLSAPCWDPYEGCSLGRPPGCTAGVAVGCGLDDETVVTAGVGRPRSLPSAPGPQPPRGRRCHRPGGLRGQQRQLGGRAA